MKVLGTRGYKPRAAASALPEGDRGTDYFASLSARMSTKPAEASPPAEEHDEHAEH
nr:hypothetical protein [uncultured Lichenicoccus sp.]